MTRPFWTQLTIATSALACACGSDPSDSVGPKAGAGAAGTAGVSGAGGFPNTGAVPGSGGGGSAGAPSNGGVAGGEPPSACETISADPQGSADANRNTIQNCLNSEHRAFLDAGVYPINGGLRVPGGAVLKGISPDRPTLVLQPGGGENFMISLEGGASDQILVSHLRIDGNDAIGYLANASTIMVNGDNATVDDTEILNAAQAPHDYTAAAVYFICGACTGNLISNSVIHDHYYGVIFQAALTPAAVNKLQGNEIHDVRCDAVTFAGYGEAIGNKIHDTGWDCNNGPIPGGGFYALNNAQGAKIIGNEVWNTCGTPLDIDSTSNLFIDGNHFHDPGYRWNGLFDYCSGAAGTLIDTGHCTIQNNVFENSLRPHNSGADPNNVTHAIGAPLFSDLPGGANGVFAFGLLSRPGTSGWFTVGNTITNNVFRSYQDPATGHVGTGLFSSRGTGYENGGWSAGTTNYFTSNTTFGSNVGSARCGGNWYAGDSTCAAGSPAPCNDDDYQHSAAYFHSDACASY